MARIDEIDEMRIGEALKRARTGQGLDIGTIEERTKIRIKYLRALEGEDWEVLPNHAYAKGFLRTYAQLLGLDADALVDAYRRQVEAKTPGDEHLYPLTEPVLAGRRRLAPGGGAGRGAGRGVPLGAIVLGVVALAVAAFFVIGTLGDDGGNRDGKRQNRAQERRADERRQERRKQASEPQPTEEVALRLEIRQPVQVCLLGGAADPLIDSQVLAAGASESFQAKAFELRFPVGYDLEQFELFVDGERQSLEETQGPAAYKIASGKVEPAPAPGSDCP